MVWFILAIIALPVFMLLPFLVLMTKKDVLPNGMEGITDADWLPDEVD